MTYFSWIISFINLVSIIISKELQKHQTKRVSYFQAKSLFSRMNNQLYTTESIRQIEIFYYSSQENIFINTVLIELLSQKFTPPNIKIIKTQLNQPNHHVFGQLPLLTLNKTQVVKNQRLWDFLILILNIEISRKYQFLSVVNLSHELAQVSNLFSEYDRNPYFLFLSPWKKFKRHKQLEDAKHYFRENSHYFNKHEESLNQEYFNYKVNYLSNLLSEYLWPDYTKPQYLNIYRIIVFALLKHLKVINDVLYQKIINVHNFKEIEEKAQSFLYPKKEAPKQKMEKELPNIGLEPIQQERQMVQMEMFDEQRPPVRNVTFTNVRLDYLKENKDENKKQEGADFQGQREKLYQSIFKPIFATTLFGLCMWAFH